MTDIGRLDTIASLLWGNSYRGHLAEALGVRRDSVQDWLQGRNPIPDFVWLPLARRLEERASAINQAHRDLVFAGKVSRIHHERTV